MLRRAIIPVKRWGPVVKRTCNNVKSTEDYVRINTFVQHTKNDIIQEVRTIVSKEFEEKFKKHVDNVGDNVATIFLLQFTVTSMWLIMFACKIKII